MVAHCGHRWAAALLVIIVDPLHRPVESPLSGTAALPSTPDPPPLPPQHLYCLCPWVWTCGCWGGPRGCRVGAVPLGMPGCCTMVAGHREWTSDHRAVPRACDHHMNWSRIRIALLSIDPSTLNPWLSQEQCRSLPIHMMTPPMLPVLFTLALDSSPCLLPLWDITTNVAEGWLMCACWYVWAAPSTFAVWSALRPAMVRRLEAGDYVYSCVSVNSLDTRLLPRLWSRPLQPQRYFGDKKGQSDSLRCPTTTAGGCYIIFGS
jgi:hypothetical protein